MIYSSFINKTACAVAGIIGIIGLAMYVAWLLLIPAGYAICTIILGIISMILIGFGIYAASGIISILIGIAIFILFYMNWKIMRERNPK